MKAAIVLALIFTAYAGPNLVDDVDSEVVPQSAIDYINSVQSSWVASKSWVGNMSIQNARSFATLTLENLDFPEYNWGSLSDYITVPASFDARTQWPNCIHPILDQGQCGSCWAFGATEALSDRFCIASNGAVDVVLSPQYLVDCDRLNFGCNGGNLALAWRYLRTNGVPTYSCVGYTAKDGTCPSKCDDGSNLTLYKTVNVNTFTTPASIQNAVLAGGPIETGFTVYQDFMSYSSGVYVHTWGNELGGHAVKIVGWGVSGSQNYWICANSWGTSWGLQGFFWIAFGQCGIDSNAIAGSASL